MAVEQSDAQNQRVAIADKLHRVGVRDRLPVSVALGEPTESVLLVAEPEKRLERHCRRLLRDLSAHRHIGVWAFSAVGKPHRAVRIACEERHRVGAQRNLKPEFIELEERRFCLGDSEDLRDRFAAGHQLEVDVDTAIVVDLIAGVDYKTIRLLRAADDYLLVGTALNEALGLVLGVIHVPVRRFAVFDRDNAHRSGEKLDSLRLYRGDHSVSADRVIAPYDVDGVLEPICLGSERDEWLRYFHFRSCAFVCESYLSPHSGLLLPDYFLNI